MHSFHSNKAEEEIILSKCYLKDFLIHGPIVVSVDPIYGDYMRVVLGVGGNKMGNRDCFGSRFGRRSSQFTGPRAISAYYTYLQSIFRSALCYARPSWYGNTFCPPFQPGHQQKMLYVRYSEPQYSIHHHPGQVLLSCSVAPAKLTRQQHS